MSRKKREGAVQSQTPLYQEIAAPEQCACLPLSPPQPMLFTGRQDEAVDEEQRVPVTQLFKQKLRSILEELFPRSAPLSLLVLHLSQWEQQAFVDETSATYMRQRYHASPELLEQVMVSISRAIRTSDQVMTHEGACAAVIFPYVDRQGMEKILERISRNVDLLQAETMLPPLTRETELLFGVGSYPEASLSLEGLLQQTGRIVRRVVLRPVITIMAHEEAPEESEKTHVERHNQRDRFNSLPSSNIATDTSLVLEAPAASNIAGPGHYPFMRLPPELPRRLKHLIPYYLACHLRCAPVGRDHHNLTVAMEDPRNADNVHYLQEVTGMGIFPVSCEADALDTLLAKKW